MTTLKEVREKLAAKQTELHKVFEEAEVTTDSGQKSYDFNKVTCLGKDVKGSIAVAEKVKAMDDELNDLASQAEKLETAEKAASALADREKVRGRLPIPGAKDEQARSRVKSLGELVAAEKAYAEWVKHGTPNGINFSYEDLLPSDMLAKGAVFETLGSKALLETGAGFAPESIRLPGFVEGATRPLQLIDIIPMSTTGQAAIKYMEETTRAHAAAEKAEGAAYAESTFVFTEKTSPVVKITDSIPVTDEQLEDVPLMQGYINSRLTFGIRQRLDGQVLVGDGAGANLRGLKNVVGIQTQAKGADPVPDAFYKAMTKVRVTGRAIPTHHVMHPEDWQGVRLLRTVDGVYIWGSPSEAGPERLWGLPVVQQDADAKGTGYVGSFQPAWISLFERKGVDIQIGYVGTQFNEGKRTVRGDMRAAFVVFRPAAFCSVTGL
ncbi:phage major capsid protein [Stappia sp. F7233]|uniref:Phage major capsid protein n=1 Tax=Stappia albiluteola TaxID=2758565 RepID=A0A839AEK9_9HYPH|nr:phage major capsid protein [Stappia albiluteola]MBA5777468.1 phage major capsid protein [Stappia albiluteola]MBA5777506.1 phage major capsid protein [Stappia albiluteola]MBA5778083.1 phage major capsid protein [Stappia albiluteola]MBA5778140.1 phage major capsid protein [Stappia albiluteola]